MRGEMSGRTEMDTSERACPESSREYEIVKSVRSFRSETA
jgi:hypothetical protein